MKRFKKKRVIYFCRYLRFKSKLIIEKGDIYILFYYENQNKIIIIIIIIIIIKKKKKKKKNLR